MLVYIWWLEKALWGNDAGVTGKGWVLRQGRSREFCIAWNQVLLCLLFNHCDPGQVIWPFCASASSYIKQHNKSIYPIGLWWELNMLMCIKKLEHWHRAMDIWVITIVYIPDGGNSKFKSSVRGRKEGQESFMYSYMSKKPMWLVSEAWYRVDGIEVGEWGRGQILASLRS